MLAPLFHFVAPSLFGAIIIAGEEESVSSEALNNEPRVTPLLRVGKYLFDDGLRAKGFTTALLHPSAARRSASGGEISAPRAL